MKDLLIAIAILLVLVAVFSHTPHSEPARHADGDDAEGDSNTIIPSDEPVELVEPPQSPQTGGWRWWFKFV